jgi:hypothetical protein
MSKLAHIAVGNGSERSSPTIASLVGTVDDRRILFPELLSGEVPRMFSSLVYKKSEDGTLSAAHAAGSTIGATALVAGTTVGAGIAGPTNCNSRVWLCSIHGGNDHCLGPDDNVGTSHRRIVYESIWRNRTSRLGTVGPVTNPNWAKRGEWWDQLLIFSTLCHDGGIHSPRWNQL